MTVSVAVTIPQWGEKAGPDAWQQIANTVEEVGFDALLRGDHVTFPKIMGDKGDLEFGPKTSTVDAFATLSFLAGCTEGISIGTNVCVVPYRHPVLLAKLALSLDALSGGRFEFGVGAGWLAPEFEVLEISHEERGSLTTEFLEVFEQVCGNDVTGFDGQFHSFPETGFYPRPTDEEGPTIWVGGDSSAALRRAARFGDGWTVVRKTPDDVREGRDRLLRAWNDYDRSSDPELAVTQQCYVGTDTEGLKEESPLVGPPDAVAEGIVAYVDAGATRITLRQPDLPIDDRIGQLRRFAEEVRPLI